MDPSPELQILQLSQRLDHEGVSILVGLLGAVAEQAGEDGEAAEGARAGGVGADEGVPRVEIWLGNLVEHLVGVVDAGVFREGGGLDKLAGGEGVEEEAGA